MRVGVSSLDKMLFYMIQIGYGYGLSHFNRGAGPGAGPLRHRICREKKQNCKACNKNVFILETRYGGAIQGEKGGKRIWKKDGFPLFGLEPGG